MNQPLPISAYPADALEGIIARAWVAMIRECEDYTIDFEPIQASISDARAMMRDAGWPAMYQHNFFVRLRNDLTELTHAHPVTRQFVTLLTIETEFN